MTGALPLTAATMVKSKLAGYATWSVLFVSVVGGTGYGVEGAMTDDSTGLHV